MAEAAIIAERESSTSASETGSVVKKRATPKRKSDMETLEGKFNSKLSNLEQKLDTFMELWSKDKSSSGRTQSQVTVEAERAARRPLVSLENSLDRDYGMNNDSFSVQLSESERRNCGFMSDTRSEKSDNSMNSCVRDGLDYSDDRFSKYVALKPLSEKEKEEKSTDKNLLSMFGEDAQTKKERSKIGIVLDESQKSIIGDSYRAEHPERLTSYRDSYRNSFPVHESCEEFFKVPTLDDTVESLLVKKHGHKAAFGSNPSLYTKSMRSVERLAYQGQMASRMGMIMCCYSQQTLATLLENLQQKDCNMDLAVQMVRDIFAMSTKTLDQVARAGAFQHMIRRRATLFDTGLSDLKDYTSTVNALPLRADGVFGPDFDSKLKSKVERNKQLTKLLPDSLFKTKKPESSATSKRKSYSSSDQTTKRPRLDSRSSATTSNNQSGQYSGGFRIPKQTYSRDGQRKVSFFRNQQKNDKA